MIKQTCPYVPLYILDRLTDMFPSAVPRIFQKIFLFFMGSRSFYIFYKVRYIHKLKQVKSFDRILIVVDVNIGDAILMQKSVEVLRYYFPSSSIDYACNRAGGEFLSGLPGVNNVHKIFSGSGIPSKVDLEELRNIAVHNDYTLIWNLSPFLKHKVFHFKIPVLHIYLPFSAYVLRLWKLRARNLQLSYALHTFLQELLSSSGIHSNNLEIIGTPDSCPYIPFNGNSIIISHEGAESAKRFLRECNLYPPKRLLFFNHNARSAFTKIPLSLQIQLIRNIAEKGDVNKILLGEGDGNTHTENTIIDSVPKELRNKIIVVPRLTLSTYAALLDACDVFISGDTGPVHIAAALKVPASRDDVFRNRTCVITVFGATDSRMYGYDSLRPDHLPANQHAPSMVFVAKNSCRNVTCINKLGKTCRITRCFDNLEAQEISNYVISYLHTLRYPSYIRTKRVFKERA